MLTLGSLCTGVGGLELAVKCGGLDFETIFVADNDPGVKIFLDHRFSSVPNLGNIQNISWENIEAPDILLAGYPCQPFSTAGKRGGTKDARHLWPDIEKAVRLFRPGIVFLENVPGHRSQGFGEVIANLASLGYVGSWTSVRAGEIGAPHRRERVFIIGLKHEAPIERSLRPFSIQQGFAPRPLLPTPAARLGTFHGVSPDVARKRFAARESGINLDDWVAMIAPHHRPDASLIWGPALRRWASIIGRSAPHIHAPIKGASRRPSPEFVEWMMGFPQGWVTDVAGLGVSQMLHMLGNAVVPLQGALAFRSMFG